MNVSYLDKIWANMLIAGDKVWADVPEERKDGVEQELIARVVSGELSEEDFKRIISK